VLESLAEHRLRATFFVIGSRADLGEAGKHAHDDPEPVGLAWRSNSRRTCSVVGGRNASSRARMASEECCFATAMRHRIAVRLATIALAASTKSSSVGAVDQTAGAGASQQRQQTGVGRFRPAR
jgi:hypothetical protein